MNLKWKAKKMKNENSREHGIPLTSAGVDQGVSLDKCITRFRNLIQDIKVVNISTFKFFLDLK